LGSIFIRKKLQRSVFSIGCGGATGVSAGLVTAPMHWQDPAKQYMAKLSLDLYNDLAGTSNFRLHRCGRLYMAKSKASEISLRRMYSRRVVYNEEAELLDDPSELLYRWPHLQTEDVGLAVLSTNDLCVDPIGLCQALAERASEAATIVYRLRAESSGVKIFEQCAVREVMTGDDNEVIAVSTDKGLVETSRFVDAGGIVRSLSH
ncbi:unnamed protein product, partial [Anisakis simplex]|uniref:DAO domain-containing protein n=1 Tax=Anisakis simplex TaxID=6269 RepID=A0A0M3KGU2_ANISI